MKKILSYLSILLFSFYLNQCTGDNHNHYIPSNIDSAYQVKNAPQSIEIDYSSLPEYTYIKSFSKNDIKKLIPNKYLPNIVDVKLIGSRGNVAYFATVILKPDASDTGKNDMDNLCYRDIFLYDMDTENLEHILNMSELNTRIYQIYSSNNLTFIYTSDGKIYKFDSKSSQFDILTKDSHYFTIYKDGIIFIDAEKNAVISFSNDKFNEYKYRMRLPTDILYGMPPFYQTKTLETTYFYILNDNLEIVNVLKEDFNSNIYPMKNIFFIPTHGKTDTILIKNYNNETIKKIPANDILLYHMDYDTLFRLKSDGSLYRYKYDQNENKILFSEINQYAAKISDFIADGGYLIACRSTNSNEDVIYDVYQGS